MNDDHADALDLYATRLLGQTGAGWRMTGIDSEGLDLRREGLVRRLPFDRPVGTAEEARKALVSLALQARATR
jgi:putative heme iron utilization protein